MEQLTKKEPSKKIQYSSKKKKIQVGFIIATIIVLIGALTMLFPYIYMFFTSFKTTTEAFGEPLTLIPTKWVSDAYLEIVKDSGFYMSIVYTLVIEISVIIIGTFFSTLAAFSFAKLKLIGKKTLLLIMMSSMMVPYAAVMLPQYRAFQALNMTETLWPLILPGLFGNISMMFFLITYMKSGIPDSLIESAKIDGASYTKMFLRLATIAGFLCSGMSLIVAIVFLIMKLLKWYDFPMGTATILI